MAKDWSLDFNLLGLMHILAPLEMGGITEQEVKTVSSLFKFVLR